MPESPLITTVIPTYNRVNLLKLAILSVQNQSFKRVKILVLDNASQDDTCHTVQALAKEDSRIEYYRHPRNIQSRPNFRFGYEKVTTPYFSFLSDDDVILPGFYEKAFELLEKHPETAFSAGQIIYMNSNGSIRSVSTTQISDVEYVKAGQGVVEMEKGHLPTWTSYLFRKSNTDKSGNISDHIIFDEEFLTNVVINEPFTLFKHPSAIFVCQPRLTDTLEKIPIYYEQRKIQLEKIRNHKTLNKQTRDRVIQAINLFDRQSMTKQAFIAFINNHPKALKALLEKTSKEYPNSKLHKLIVTYLILIRKFPLLSLLTKFLFRIYRIIRNYINNLRYAKHFKKYVQNTFLLYKSNFGKNWYREINAKE